MPTSYGINITSDQQRKVGIRKANLKYGDDPKVTNTSIMEGLCNAHLDSITKQMIEDQAEEWGFWTKVEKHFLKLKFESKTQEKLERFAIEIKHTLEIKQRVTPSLILRVLIDNFL